jgi:predicted nucleic acid-binding protein
MRVAYAMRKMAGRDASPWSPSWVGSREGAPALPAARRARRIDALLAATALRLDAEALISGDIAFGQVAGLRFVALGSPELDSMIG